MVVNENKALKERIITLSGKLGNNLKDKLFDDNKGIELDKIKRNENEIENGFRLKFEKVNDKYISQQKNIGKLEMNLFNIKAL